MMKSITKYATLVMVGCSAAMMSLALLSVLLLLGVLLVPLVLILALWILGITAMQTLLLYTRLTLLRALRELRSINTTKQSQPGFLPYRKEYLRTVGIDKIADAIGEIKAQENLQGDKDEQDQSKT